jgi:hypothetical protein
MYIYVCTDMNTYICIPKYNTDINIKMSEEMNTEMNPKMDTNMNT